MVSSCHTEQVDLADKIDLPRISRRPNDKQTNQTLSFSKYALTNKSKQVFLGPTFGPMQVVDALAPLIQMISFVANLQTQTRQTIK